MYVTPSNATREGKCFITRKITIRKAHAPAHTNFLTIVLLFLIYKQEKKFQLQSLLSTNKIRNDYTYNDMTHNAEISATCGCNILFYLKGFVLCT